MRHGLKRAARLTLKGLGLGLLGLVLLLCVALLLLRLPSARQMVRERVNHALADGFAGRLELTRIGRLSLAGTSGLDLSVFDAGGRRSLRASGCEVRLDGLGLAVSLLRHGASGSTIHVDLARCEHLELRLIDDGHGEPTLLHAFDPRHPSPTPSASPGLELPRVEVGQIWVHGQIAGAPAIDVELHRLDLALNKHRDLALELFKVNFLARGLPVVGETRGYAQGALDVPERGELRVAANVVGQTPGQYYSLAGGMRGKRVAAALWSPDLAPLLLHQLSPTQPTPQPTWLVARAQGTLDALRIDAWIDGAAGKISLQTRLESQGRATRIESSLRTRALELRHWVGGAPPATLDLDATLAARGADGDWRAEFQLDDAGSRISGERLQRLTLSGHVHQDPSGALQASADGQASLPGLDLEFHPSYASTPAPSASARITAELDHPSALAALAGIDAAGRLEADARYELDAKRLAVSARARLSRLSVGDQLALRGLRLRANLEGSLPTPAIEAELDAARAKLADRTLEQLRGRAHGTPKRLELELKLRDPQSGPNTLRASLSLERGIRVSNLALTRAGTPEPLRVRADQVRVSDGEIRVQNLSWQGIGRGHASLVYRRGLQSLEVEAEELDLARLERQLGVTLPLRQGRLSLEGRYARGQGQGFLRGSARGVRLVQKQEDGSVLDLKGRGDFDLKVQAGTLRGRADLAFGRSRAELELDSLKLAASVLERPQALLAPDSHFHLDAALDLDELSESGALARLGVARAGGKTELAADLPPASAQGARALQAHLRTNGFELVLERKPATKPIKTREQAIPNEPFALRGIDADALLRVAIDDGALNVRGTLFDSSGLLADLEYHGEIALRGLLERPARLLDTPFQAMLTLPERSLESLPPLLRPATLQGRFGAQWLADGTVRKPRLRAHLRLSSALPSGDHGQKLEPLSADALLEYSPAGGKLELQSDARGNEVLNAKLDWRGDLKELPSALGDQARSPVQAHARLNFHDFPLGSIPTLNAHRVRGRVTGRAELRNFGSNALFVLEARADDFSVGRSQPARATIDARLGGGSARAELALASGDGSLELKLTNGFAWNNRVLPVLETRRTLDAEFHRFDLRTIFPLLEGNVSELAGQIDGQVELTENAGARNMRGALALHAGVLELPTIGQRFHDMEARVAIANQRVTLSSFRAAGTVGTVTGSGAFELLPEDAFRAQAKLQIDEHEKLPVTLEGVSFGDAWGRAELSVERSVRQELALSVKVPSLHVVMPEMAPTSVQSLDPAAGVKVGVFKKDGDFVVLPVQPIEDEGAPSKTLLRVELGSDVWVEQGEELKAQVGGAFSAALGQQTDLEGRLDLRGGTLDVSGKRFEIEQGTITLHGKPDDAQITATARWDSPDRFSVYADFTGSVKDGKIRLHSDPPLSQDEILSLLLFGAPDGSVGSSGGSQAGAAAAVAGGSATKGLNQLLSRFSHLDVSARVDTSTGTSRPELVVQLTPRITARVTRALGDPQPGQSPDRTFVTLELRLPGRWSVATIVGDQGGTALEIAWRVRF